MAAGKGTRMKSDLPKTLHLVCDVPMVELVGRAFKEAGVAKPVVVVGHQPTLGMVRDAMTSGLIARLAGDGVIEPDQDQTLIGEIDVLIERHGRDAVAEEYMRFE